MMTLKTERKRKLSVNDRSAAADSQ